MQNPFQIGFADAIQTSFVKPLLTQLKFYPLRLLRHIKLLFCMNASIHRKQFCMALNSYKDKTNYRTKYIEIKIK